MHNPIFGIIMLSLQACKSASDPWLAPCAGLTSLLQASKKACDVAVKAKGFALPKEGTPEGERLVYLCRMTLPFTRAVIVYDRPIKIPIPPFFFSPGYSSMCLIVHMSYYQTL